MSEPGWYVATDQSYDGEYTHGPFVSREEALEQAAALAKEIGRSTRVARFIPYAPSVDALRVIEAALEDAEFEAGERATKDWMATSIRREDEAELARRLSSVFRAWLAEKGLEPRFLVAAGPEREIVLHTPDDKEAPK